MKFFVPAKHVDHQPTTDLSDGLPGVQHPERPNRVNLVLDGVRRAGLNDIETVDGDALAAVRALHDADYVDFLDIFSGGLDDRSEFIPPIFRNDLSAAPLGLRGGMYCAEIGTPIGRGSISAAHNAAATALAAAAHVRAGAGDAVALCRPPGHHAGKRRYGGYCFFNNAYVAARHLADADRRCCPVLDIDYHLGDGSIEFATTTTPYLSLHADPERNYPYVKAPTGPHMTLSALPPETRAENYLATLGKLIATINALQPDAIVVSVGFDTVAGDDIQDDPMQIAVAEFSDIGQAVARLAGPLCLVLEGGYDAQTLADCAQAFFSGLRAGRA
jgi:acetoin utilization deacetylase AcuC-like enzyme